MNGLDIIISVVVGVSVIYSLFRGFVRDIFSLVSIILGFFAAGNFYLLLAKSLFQLIRHEAIANIISFILIFIVISLLVRILGRLIRRFIEALKLGIMDRVLGAGLGILKGSFIVMVITFILSSFLPPSHPIFVESKLIPYVIALKDKLIDMSADHVKGRTREISRKAILPPSVMLIQPQFGENMIDAEKWQQYPLHTVIDKNQKKL